MFGEYANYGQLHGLSKFLADLRISEDLYEVRDILKKYTKNPTDRKSL